MELIIVRHGEANYSFIDPIANKNYWKNFAGLTLKGVTQAKKLSKNKLLHGADIILSSPYTRAYETALILSQELNIPVKVDIDLREWEHEKSYQFDKLEFKKMMDEVIENKGLYNCSCKYKWESLEVLGERAIATIKKYEKYKKVIVVSHKMLMGQFIYNKEVNNCDIFKINFTSDIKPIGFIDINKRGE